MVSAAAAISYGTRMKVISFFTSSKMEYDAAGLPSRGCPTEPSTTSQRRRPCSARALSVTGLKAVIFATVVTLKIAGLCVWPQKVICALVARRLREASSTVST